MARPKATQRERIVPRFEVFKGKKGDWWWRLRSSNGQVVGGSAEGFKRRSHAIQMTRTLAGDFAMAHGEPVLITDRVTGEVRGGTASATGVAYDE
jgi:uncharacterized protein YegP (UPF0339 family)